MSADSGQLEKQAVEEFLSGKLAQVDVLAIERELRKLWQEASAHEAEPDGQNVARACVLNLILYSHDHGAEISAGNILDEIMLSHPCRALLAIAAEGEAPHIDAWVSARCHLAGPGSTKQICCEQIAVKSQGQSVEALPSVVIPLLVPDLPVFLWWRADHFNTQAISPFLAAIDRLIFDSLSWRLDSGFFLDASVFAHRSDGAVPADLNWGRLLHWRRLIAKAFDSLSLGINVGDLKKIEAVRLEFVPQAVGQVTLLTGWLANQLKWEPFSATAGKGTREIQFEADTGNVSVNWVERKSSTLPEGGLSKVQLSLTGERTLTIKLVLMDGKPSLAASVESLYGSSREVLGRGPILDESALVEKELDILDRDQVFEKTLKMASHIVNLFG